MNGRTNQNELSESVSDGVLERVSDSMTEDENKNCDKTEYERIERLAKRSKEHWQEQLNK